MDREKRLLGLVLAPTRELALQVCTHITALAKGLFVKVRLGLLIIISCSYST